MVWLTSLEILGNMCIVITCCPVFDVINVEIILSSRFPSYHKSKKSV